MKFKHYISKLTLLLLFAVMSNFTFAQRSITGKVTDAENGEALIGATLTCLGAKSGTLTDVDGNYTLSVPAGVTQVVFTYAGYAPQTITLGASNVVNVSMKGGAILEELVVVGYGSLKNKEITSSVTSIKAEDFNKGNINDPTQLLQGKVPGLGISRAGNDPNAGFEIRLRGLSTIGANAQPLVIVDGVQGVPLTSVDPNDIESIDVLRDGSASAIYGTRGSSGVILITTKKGQAGKTTMEYNGQVSTESIAKSVSIMDAGEFVAAGGPDHGSATDWVGEISQTAITHTHNLAMGGGLRGTSYRVAFNYRDVDGILRTSGFNQLNGRLNLTQKALNDRLTVNFDLSATNKNANNSFLEAFRYAVLFNPTDPVLADESSSIFNTYGGYNELELFDYYNPVAMIEQNSNTTKTNTLLSSIRGEYEIVDGLKFAVSYAQTRENKLSQEFYSKQSRFRGTNRNGLAIQGNENRLSEQFGATINYNTTFGDATDFSILGGYEYLENTYDGFGVLGGNFLTNEFTFNNFSASNDFYRGLAIPGSYRNNNKLASFFGRANLSINETYFLMASVRRDGSSQFGENNKWGMFPAFSAGVALNKALGIDNIDALKLRVGYGSTGQLPPYSYLSINRYGAGAFYPYNGNYVQSYSPVQNSNPDLAWEKKGELNVGVDFAFMDYKISGSLEYYSRIVKDLIYEIGVPVPPNQASRTWVNVGQLSSNGIDFVLNVAPAKFWETGLTLNYALANDIDTLGNDKYTAGGGRLELANVGAPGLNGINMILAESNAPIGQIYGPVFAGVSETGTNTYEDLDGDGVIEPNGDDREVLGYGLPKILLGWNNTFKFGNMDLNFLLRGAFGHSLVNSYRIFYENLDPGAITSWNRVNTEYFDPTLKEAAYSSRYVEDAGFVKLDNFTLGYNIPVADGSAFRSVRLFLGGNNLFVLTNYSGVDPEPRYSDKGDPDNGGEFSDIPSYLAPGLDRRSTYFRSRSFVLGVNLGF
jgi:TonB-linked SusC/RagA family outer membrane protein